MDTLETWFGQPLPTAFVAALEQHGGRFAEPDLLLYAADELLEHNRAFGASLYYPGYLAIGSGSDGRVVVMTLDDHQQALSLVDHDAVTSDCFKLLASSSEAWLGTGSCLPE